MTAALILIALLGASALLWAWRSSDLILRGIRDRLTIDPGVYGFPFTTESFASEDGVRLEAWWVPSEVSSDKTILLCHGRGATRSDALARTHFLRAGGWNLLYLDFRNHGASGAGVSSLGRLEVRDVAAAMAHLRTAHAEDARHVALFGASMGGAVCLMAAADDPSVEAVVAESPYASFNGVVARFGRLFYGLPPFPFARLTLWAVRRRLGFNPEDFAPERIIGRIAPRPVFLIQGSQDRRMPPTEGERLYAAAGEPKELWTVPGADHGEISDVAGRDYAARITDFFRRVWP